MTSENRKSLPKGADQQRRAFPARSMRQAHPHLLRALRNTVDRMRVKAFVTGIEHSEGRLFIGLVQAARDEEKHWVLRARVARPVHNALEDAIGGPLNQRYIGAEIVADIDLGLTNEFRLVATISNIVEIRPYEDF